MTALATAPAMAQGPDPFDLALTQADLTFPDEPRPFATGHESMMFKPDGAGPFPAPVLMPACDGHSRSVHVFEWAHRALDHGYAALVVDPQTPRGVFGLNCNPPLAVNPTRLLKDAFDAAQHLRKQPFVDKARIGLIGFSLGAMVGLGASGAKYGADHNGERFRAIVSIYPVCIFKQIQRPGFSGPFDTRWLPEKIVVPLLVEMGDRDNEGSPDGTAADCRTLLDPLMARGDPVHDTIYHATHEWDDRQSDGIPKRGFNGQNIMYFYSAEATEQSVNDAFAFLQTEMGKER